MSVNVTPHLNFRGQAREALEFYKTATGGNLVAVTYADAQAVQDPKEADQIMWGQVEAEGGFRVMGYDVPGALAYDQGDRSHFVSLRSESEQEIKILWQGLKKGSEVLQDLGPAAWAPLYGMLKDPFGVTWVLDVAVPYEPS